MSKPKCKRGRPRRSPEELAALREKAETLYYLTSCSVARIARNLGVSEKTVNDLLDGRIGSEQQ